jgi:hypothetical protein
MGRLGEVTLGKKGNAHQAAAALSLFGTTTGTDMPVTARPTKRLTGNAIAGTT